MKNLSEFKKLMTVGSQWTFRSHWTSGVNYLRTCNIKQTNACALTSIRNENENSWLYWPKAKDCIFHESGVYIMVEPALVDCFKESLKKGHIYKSVDPYLYYEPMTEEN